MSSAACPIVCPKKAAPGRTPQEREPFLAEMERPCRRQTDAAAELLAHRAPPGIARRMLARSRSELRHRARRIDSDAAARVRGSAR